MTATVRQSHVIASAQKAGSEGGIRRRDPKAGSIVQRLFFTRDCTRHVFSMIPDS